jgi:hypothetical protein
MADTVAPEFARFVEAERRAQRLPAATRPMAEGEVFKPVFIEAGRSAELLRVAARRAAGFFRPSTRNEVVWVEVDVKLSTGLIRIGIPVRCDQTGPASIELLFAVGSPTQPAGLYAAAARRPNGPDIIVSTWGDALVAFAWQCVLDLVTGIAAATGKDQRGNLLVPVEIAVTGRGIEIVPMARHRFAGSSTLKSSTKIGKLP